MIVILHKHLVEKKTRKIGNEFVRRLGCYLILDIIVRTFWEEKEQGLAENLEVRIV